MALKVDTLKGRIFLSDETPTHIASVYITIEDTLVADAAAKVIEEKKLEDVMYDPAEGIPFTILAAGDYSKYSVRVHVDMDSDGKVGAGDYLTTQHYSLRELDNIIAKRV